MKEDKTHNTLRTVDFHNLKIGDKSCSPIFCLDISIFNTEENFDLVKKFYGTTDREKLVDTAQKTSCDVLSLKFNISTESQIPQAVDVLRSLLARIQKPLMIRGINDNNLDKILLPELIKILDRQCIISSANENTYRSVVPYAVKGNHILVLKSPIDINLAKELNILASDMGLDLNKILMDTDIGGLGYGLEYGYSMMEKIRLEGLNGDEYLNMPLISFAAEESLKTKEAKSENYDKNWGDLTKRAEFFEITAASAAMAAGASVIVLHNPKSVVVMKGLI